MLIFPPQLAQPGQEDRPLIVFRNQLKKTSRAQHIVFPIPQSIQFSDSASYNPTELGFSGASILTVGRSSNVESAFSSLKNNALGAIPSNLKHLAGLISANKLSGETKSAMGIATGTTMNKNMVSEFSGISTRQYNFQFKMISQNITESDLIKNIVNTFRDGLYPEGDSLQLRYPATWYINFMQREMNIKYLPKMFETYLQNMSTTYNSTMNLFHFDGSPVECDIQLSFIESRALTQQDIRNLEDHEFRDGDFKSATSHEKVREIAENLEKIQMILDKDEKLKK